MQIIIPSLCIHNIYYTFYLISLCLLWELIIRNIYRNWEDVCMSTREMIVAYNTTVLDPLIWLCY